jgi:hypothetical protein
MVNSALGMALEHRGTGGLIHTDHGPQFTSWTFSQNVRNSGLIQSIGSVGDCPLTGQSRGTLSTGGSASIGRLNRHYPGPPGLPISDWPDKPTTMPLSSRSGDRCRSNSSTGNDGQPGSSCRWPWSTGSKGSTIDGGVTPRLATSRQSSSNAANNISPLPDSHIPGPRRGGHATWTTYRGPLSGLDSGVEKCHRAGVAERV